jgi:hypothetical protein
VFEGSPAINAAVAGKIIALEDILYTFYRCPIVHEAGFDPTVVEMVPTAPGELYVQAEGPSETFKLGSGIIDILISIRLADPELQLGVHSAPGPSGGPPNDVPVNATVAKRTILSNG